MNIPMIVASQAGIAAGIASRNARLHEEERKRDMEKKKKEKAKKGVSKWTKTKS